MKHTPGPWKVEPMAMPIGETSSLHVIWTADENHPMPTLPVARTMFAPASEANARLIAAAPELLEACQWLHPIIVERFDPSEFAPAVAEQIQFILDKVEAAIEKAEAK